MDIVEEYARSPLDAFKLWQDKSYFFSLSGRCVIAYRVANNMAIAPEILLDRKRRLNQQSHNFCGCAVRKNGGRFLPNADGFHADVPSVAIKKIKNR